MGTAVFFGNRVRDVRMERSGLERIGIRVQGQVLAGKMGVREAQEFAGRRAENSVQERDTVQLAWLNDGRRK